MVKSIQTTKEGGTMVGKRAEAGLPLAISRGAAAIVTISSVAAEQHPRASGRRSAQRAAGRIANVKAAPGGLSRYRAKSAGKSRA